MGGGATGAAAAGGVNPSGSNPPAGATPPSGAGAASPTAASPSATAETGPAGGVVGVASTGAGGVGPVGDVVGGAGGATVDDVPLDGAVPEVADGQDAGAGGELGGGGAGSETDEGSEAGGATGTDEGGLLSSCVGEALPAADPTRAGPFQVAADKNVGPLAGVVPDPIYGDQQQRFNVYRPANLADSGYCHPVLIWANGYRDNPEQNPPDCIVDSGANRWCGQYSPLLNHLASHGFVVVASLSTATAEGDPLPTIAGLDWILEQAEDPSSPYYNRLDTANMGQLGHSYGGMSTCMSASEPRYKALATICGTRELNGVHTPMLFFCGGKDTTVDCAGVRDTFLTVTDQPAFFLDELNADHGSWVYQGAGGVSLSSAAAWFRAHLMGDTESRKYFYGPNCTFCSDNRVQVEQNSLMTE